jgi:hypothetical protein
MVPNERTVSATAQGGGAHSARRPSQAEWDAIAWRLFRQLDLPVLKEKVNAVLHNAFN